MHNRMKPFHIVLVTTFLVAAFLGAYGLAAYGLLNPKPKPLPTTLVHKADLGEQYKSVAVKYIVQAAAQNGLTVTNTKVLKVSEKGNAATVRVELTSDYGIYVIDVVMTKSLWVASDFKIVSQKPPSKKS